MKKSPKRGLRRPSGTPDPACALTPLAALYLFSLLLAASNYGHPFPFLGRFYLGGAGEGLVLADGLVSLYLLIGILKRQRLALWLLIGYNLLDICNAWLNLLLIPAGSYAQAAGIQLPEGELRLNSIAASLLLVMLSLYAFVKRRLFDNHSPYLF